VGLAVEMEMVEEAFRVFSYQIQAELFRAMLSWLLGEEDSQ